MAHDRERFMAWISKYALTSGILEREVERKSDGDIVWIVGANGKADWINGSFHGEGKDWHRTKSDAIARAKIMQAAKLKSIDKQRARVAALKFE